MAQNVEFVDLEMIPDGQLWDLGFGDDGDFLTENSFDTFFLQAFFTDARAVPSQVPIASKRRGWHGNEFLETEQGSLLWLLEQARLNTATLNLAIDICKKAVSTLVIFGYARDVTVTAQRTTDDIQVNVTVERYSDQVEHRNFLLWENTGES